MKMDDEYSHDSYTVLRATGLLHEAVDHVLAQERTEVSEGLRRDLQEWREKPREREKYGVEDVDAMKPIPFELVRRVHEQLKQTPMGIGLIPRPSVNMEGGCITKGGSL